MVHLKHKTRGSILWPGLVDKREPWGEDGCPDHHTLYANSSSRGLLSQPGSAAVYKWHSMGGNYRR